METLQPIFFHPVYGALIYITGIVLCALCVNLFVKRILIRVLEQIIKNTSYGRDQDLRKHPIIPRVAKIIPAIFVSAGAKIAPHISETVTTVIQNVSHAFIILMLSMTLSSVIGLFDTIYHRRPDGRLKPIRTYLQAAKVGLYVITIILVVATLFDRSPAIMLSGLGAMAAVLMLIFQDTLLSIVAGVQISSNDLIRLGDWIEMKTLNANGEVVDIALHTVRVQNWDKTYTNIPIRKLVTDAFINWRGMRESGGRRIMRSVHLDQNSIRFLTSEEIESFKGMKLLQTYLERKEYEIKLWNRELGDYSTDERNIRKMTNIGVFRAYMSAYLHANNKLRKDMFTMVRQLAPGPHGVPIEIYCFTDTIIWDIYEDIQSDIFDHVFSILPIFGLRVYQEVGSHDFKHRQSDILIPMP